MPNLPEVIAASAFFGAMVICPLVYMLMRHQRNIAEIIHRNAGDDLRQRLAAVEHEIRELRSERNALTISQDDLDQLKLRT